MALTTDQRSSNLFKKLMGVAETDTSRAFFEEPFKYESPEWTEKDLIPTTAPVLANNATLGVVQYFEDMPMTAVPGTTDAFYLEELKNAIPFNFGDGSYNYTLKNNSGSQIFFGQGDWVVDNISGVIVFYSGNPGDMPPMITFYKYVGLMGFGSGTSGGTVAYTTTFTNADLVGGMLVVDHNLNAMNNITDISIKDNNNRHIEPDDVIDNTPTRATIDFRMTVPLIGTWTILVTCIEDSSVVIPPIITPIINSAPLNGGALN